MELQIPRRAAAILGREVSVLALKVAESGGDLQDLDRVHALGGNGLRVHEEGAALRMRLGLWLQDRGTPHGCLIFSLHTRASFKATRCIGRCGYFSLHTRASLGDGFSSADGLSLLSTHAGEFGH